MFVSTLYIINSQTFKNQYNMYMNLIIIIVWINVCCTLIKYVKITIQFIFVSIILYFNIKQFLIMAHPI